MTANPNKAERLLASLLTVDRRLKKKGFHGLSPAYKSVYARFVASGKRTLVLRKGRRGGGTSSAAEFIVAVLLSIAEVPKGSTWVFALISHTNSAGRDILCLVREFLEALNVEFDATADRIILTGRAIEVRVFAPTRTSVRGISCCGALVDECAFIGDSDDALAQAIVESALLPAMSTIPGAPLLLVSSPHGFVDYHAQRFALGDCDSPSQMIAHVPSWIGNSLLTEQACRELASSETDFLREYAAEPQDSIVTRPFPVAWLANLDHVDAGEPIGRRVVCTDPSSGAHDSWVWVVAGWNRRSDGEAILSIDIADGVFGAWARDRGGPEVFDQLASDAKRCGATDLFTDSREIVFVTAGCREHSLRMNELKHTTESKHRAVKRLQLYLEYGKLALPIRNRERIRQQLKRYQQSETRSGLVRFGGRGKKSDDFVAALLTLMLADEMGALEGGTNQVRRHRDPPPRAGSPLKSYRMVYNARPHPIDCIELDCYGRVQVGRGNKSPLSGGGF